MSFSWIADISLDAKEKLPVAIFPEVDGVLVKNAKNQFEVWLTGSVEYGICTYQYEEDCSTCHLAFTYNVQHRLDDLFQIRCFNLRSTIL
jgi:hypothetical protein